jgi:hypothetical protein
VSPEHHPADSPTCSGLRAQLRLEKWLFRSKDGNGKRACRHSDAGLPVPVTSYTGRNSLTSNPGLFVPGAGCVSPPTTRIAFKLSSNDFSTLRIVMYKGFPRLSYLHTPWCIKWFRYLSGISQNGWILFQYHLLTVSVRL